MELLGSRPPEQRLVRVGRQARALQQRGDQHGGLLVCQRRKVDRRRVRQPGRPGRSALVELGTGRAEHEQRHPLGPVGQVLQEREEGGVGPVQVLEHEHRLALLRPGLQVAPPGRERLFLRNRLRRAPTSSASLALSPSPSRPSASSARSSFAAAFAAESDSRMPHSALTTSPSAQNAIPSPYGR
jgi:hypothetical protein